MCIIGSMERIHSMHWLTRYDPDDGEPYGTLCDCDIGDDHDGGGNVMNFRTGSQE